ncbi:MAG: glycosyltransferase [Bacteroidia bacterium]|nr:glycosyltransferase [Bacteroidia bacterium]
MRIMWLTSQLLPKVAKQLNKEDQGSGGWVPAMLEQLQYSGSVEAIDIVSVYNLNEVLSFSDDRIKYTLLPSTNGVFKYDPNLWKYLSKEIESFKPDIIDVQGIEFFLSRSLLDVKINTPIIATLHGLTSEIHKHFFAGIPIIELLRNRTFRDNILFDGIIERKYRYKARGENEIFVLKKIKNVFGRTRWDEVVALQHNKDLQYFKCNNNLNEVFYSQKWELAKVKRHSLFTTQAHYPIKGLHKLLEALSLLVLKYPNICLYVAGKNMIKRQTLYERLAFSGYQKYIRRLIKRFKLQNHVVFTGYLNPEEIVEQLKKTHVFVIPSMIENSPTALAEAQMVGTPSVAALVGGVADYVDHGNTGLLYNCNEPIMLSDKIEQIFMDDSLALRLSENAKKAATERHDKTKNCKALLSAYSTIINKKE